MGTVFDTKAGDRPGPRMRTENTGELPKRKQKREHVVLRDGGKLLCLHCGETYAPTMPAPINVVSAIWKSFAAGHKRCKLRACGLACGYCFAFGHEPEKCPRLHYANPEAWWNGPDTGLSSKTIWLFMRGHRARHDVHFPYDPDDFGRCHRLLQAFPEWRARIGELAAVPGWEKLAPAWDELEALYIAEVPTGRAPRLYARMAELRGGQ